jgi:hypothetical protein
VDISRVHSVTRTATDSSGHYNYTNAVAVPALGAGCNANSTNTIFCDWLADLYNVNLGDSLTGQHWQTYSQIKDQRWPGDSLGAYYAAGGDDESETTVGAFFQDTWKMHPNLTVNVGVRYDVQLLPGEPAPNTRTPLLTYYTSTINRDYAGIAPRLGIAWNFKKNNVLRVGFGEFIANTSISTVQSTRRTTGLREQSFTCTPGAATLPCSALGVFPNVLWAQMVYRPQAPFTAADLTAAQQPRSPTIVNPPGDLCATSPTSCAVRGMVPDFINPRSYEVEAAYERQLPGNINASASYIFTRGTHLPGYWDANIAPTSSTKTYDVLSSATGTPSTLLTSTVPFYSARIDPTVGPILTAFSVINSSYNAMVLTVRKPMSHGIEILGNYTLSKSSDFGEASNNTSLGIAGLVNFSGPGVPDPYNLKTEQSPSGNDNRHRFTSSIVWQPGFGKNASNRFERGLVSGWSLAGTITATTGTPYSGLVNSSAVQCLTKGQVGGKGTSACVGAPGLEGGMTTTILSTTATASGGRIMWVPRNSFYLPGYHNVDLRLAKEFSIHERFGFEIRAETFNLLNSTIVLAVNQNAYNYVAAGTGVCMGHVNTCMAPVVDGAGNPTLGQITTTSSNLLGARQMQFGARFTF